MQTEEYEETLGINGDLHPSPSTMHKQAKTNVSLAALAPAI